MTITTKTEQQATGTTHMAGGKKSVRDPAIDLVLAPKGVDFYSGSGDRPRAEKAFANRQKTSSPGFATRVLKALTCAMAAQCAIGGLRAVHAAPRTCAPGFKMQAYVPLAGPHAINFGSWCYWHIDDFCVISQKGDVDDPDKTKVARLEVERYYNDVAKKSLPPSSHAMIDDLKRTKTTYGPRNEWSEYKADITYCMPAQWPA